MRLRTPERDPIEEVGLDDDEFIRAVGLEPGGRRAELAVNVAAGHWLADTTTRIHAGR